MTTTPPVDIATGILPWTHSCFVCGQDNPRGLQLKSRYEDGIVSLVYTTRETDVGWRHIVHGGIAMTLLDEVMTWAAILVAGRACVAAEMTTRLKAPIRANQVVHAEAEVTTSKTRLIVTQSTLADEEGRPLVTAVGKYVPMPEDDMTLCSKDFIRSPNAIDIEAIFRSNTGHGTDQP